MNRYSQDFSHEKPPRRIVCQNCGSPAEFDIVAQSYRCAYCRQISGLEKKGKKPSTWRQFASKNNRQRDFQLQRHACPACGAKVIFQHNESSETCDFCASKLIRTHLDVPEQFPDLIIPFFITADEARQRFLDWAKRHKRAEESRNIIQKIDQMQAYYLPYRMVRGEANGVVTRDGVKREFPCKVYIRNMAVNTSRQLDNLLINEIEPFDWSQSQDFEYAYVAGQKVKLTDISEKDIHYRILQEAEDEFLPEMRQMMHTRAVLIILQTNSNLMNKNALLPVYFIKDGDFCAFMNGQTGRVSASCGKYKHSFNSWIVKATAASLISYLLCLGLLFSLGKSPTWKEVIDLSGALAVFWIYITIFIFGLSGENKKWRLSHIKTEQGSNTKSYRQDEKLYIDKNDKVIKSYHELVFQEDVGNGIPVKLEFLPLKRIGLMALNCFTFTFLPVIIALIIRPFIMIAKGVSIFHVYDGMFIWGGFLWYVFAPFYCLYYLSRGLSRFIYEKPFVYQIMPDGTHKHLPEFDTKIFFDVFDISSNSINFEKICFLCFMSFILVLSVWVLSIIRFQAA